MRKENTPVIETERLILRKFSEKDVKDIFLIFGDKEVNRFLPWFPLNSIDEAEEYLHTGIFPEYTKGSAYRWAVVCRQTNEVIGYVNVGDTGFLQQIGQPDNGGGGDFGYGLRRKFWGQGIISEAAKAALQKLKENGFRFITATHDINNPKSGGVMENIGMKYICSYQELWMPKNLMVTFKLYRIDF
jgi:RimJ/RimL family protein N-acetyltransferase